MKTKTKTKRPKKGETWRVWVFDYAFQVDVEVSSVKDGRVKADVKERLGSGKPRGSFVGSVEGLMERGELVG